MTIWRDQAKHRIAYTLPRAQFSKSLIPSERYDIPALFSRRWPTLSAAQWPIDAGTR